MSQKRCEIGPRLPLVTNRKSYTGLRLAPRAMTLDDLEHQNRGFMDFLGRFWAVRHISRAICAKITRNRQGQASMKFSALNVDFNGSSLDLLGSRKPAHEDIKEWYPLKVIFTIVGQSSMKMVAHRHGHAAFTASTNDKIFSRVNINDSERP